MSSCAVRVALFNACSRNWRGFELVTVHWFSYSHRAAPAGRPAGRPAGCCSWIRAHFFKDVRVCGVRTRKERNICAEPIYRRETWKCASVLFPNSKADVPNPTRRSYRAKRQRGFNNRRKAARLILLRKKHRRICRRISLDYPRAEKKLKIRVDLIARERIAPYQFRSGSFSLCLCDK